MNLPFFQPNLCLNFILWSSSYHVAFNTAKIRLHSPLVTNWGRWGNVEQCPNSTYAVGMQLKVEQTQPWLHDDTGLNGVRLLCGNLSGNFEDASNLTKIQSTVGRWGMWGTEFVCNSGLVVGFQLRSESDRRMGDDTAANNLRLVCSDGQILEGDGTPWGQWTTVQQCRKRQAVCSVQTQVEMSQGAKDDTALNNIRMDCCDVPNPAENCKPSDFWELVAECDNTNAFTPTTCTYEKKIGMGYSTVQANNPESSTSSHEKSILDSIGFNLGLEASVLSQKFQIGAGIGDRTETGYNWGASRTDTWNHESTTKVSFDIPPGVRSSMVQVVGSCGHYLVRTAKFRRIDSIGLGTGNVIPIVPNMG